MHMTGTTQRKEGAGPRVAVLCLNGNDVEASLSYDNKGDCPCLSTAPHRVVSITSISASQCAGVSITRSS